MSFKVEFDKSLCNHCLFTFKSCLAISATTELKSVSLIERTLAYGFLKTEESAYSRCQSSINIDHSPTPTYFCLCDKCI